MLQFVLRLPQASALNAQLRRDALERSRCGAGVRVSNAGGFHSATETLNAADEGSWHAPLASLLAEALHAVHADGQVAGCPIERLHMRGWINVALSPSNFNRPHDHGGIAYSAVYFVGDGGPPASPLPPGWSCARCLDSGRPYYLHVAQQLSQWEPPPCDAPLLERCAGQLVFQTQRKAWTDCYSIFSIPPSPGSLWLFPAYMPHAVLPHELPLGAAAAASSPGSERAQRISVACNISTESRPLVAELPAVWQASRMR